MNINLRVTVIALIIAVCSMCSHNTMAQQVWTLQQCIDYATANSIDIQQQKLRCEAQQQQLNTTKLSALPSLNGSVSQQFSFGRATGLDNIIVNRNQMMTGFGVSASMPIFTGLRMTNQVKADKFSLQAALAQLESAKEDIELNITGYYLQALYYKSLIDVAQKQMTLSEEQVKRTAKLVENGKVSETELFDHQSQLALDIQNLTECYNNYQLAIMDLAQMMNLADINNFDIATIEQKNIEEGALAALIQPEAAYDSSLTARPSIRVGKLNVESQKANVKVAKAAYIPQLNFMTDYSTGFYHFINGENQPFGDQLRNNGSTMVGFSLNIPLFNRLQSYNAVQQAKIQLSQQELELERTKQQLRKQIQSAYYNAVAAYNKYQSATATTKASQTAFEYAQKKYDAGKSSAYDYQNAKTRYQKAEVEELQALYEFVLRSKIFNFYSRR